jgi:preprotein translocase subunit YajC
MTRLPPSENVNSSSKLMTCFRLTILLFAAGIGGCIPAHALQEPTTANSSNARAIGTVTAINGNSLTLKTDSGTETTVAVPDTARIVKAEPGQKDLKNATPIHLQDVQVGDRALVRGKPGENHALEASSMIVMKQSDVASRQQQEVQEWQRRGAGGIVHSVDPASGTITLSTGPNQTLAIQTSANTLFLRYAPDSVKFSDAKKSSISDIKPGDQLRARGNRSADGQQLTADAVISGSFRNIAGTLNSVDASANTLNVNDLITKKSVVVKITPDTQLRKIPPEMAQRIAFFLRRSSGPGGPGGESQSGAAGPGANSQGAGMRPGGAGAGAGRPDFQQIIRRMPSATIADLQKGDAVMIVTTSGAPGEPVTALTLLSGVEPILTAAPTQTSANLLSGWSMGGGGEGENQQ